MLPSIRSVAASGLLLLLAACGQSDSEPGPGGVTVGEARALDEAAAMLEEQRMISPEESEGTQDSNDEDAPSGTRPAE